MATALEEHAATLMKDLQSRMDAINRLIATTPRPPDPRSQESDTTLRRRIERLRSGRAYPTDHAGDPEAAADAAQKELDYRLLMRLIAPELDKMSRILSSDLGPRAAALMAKCVAVFHALKRMPEAQDPNSEVSAWIRKLDRARRGDSGRRRRK